MVARHKYNLAFSFFGNVALAGVLGRQQNTGHISVEVYTDIIPIYSFASAAPKNLGSKFRSVTDALSKQK